jgi:hypothetical protein
MNILQSKRAQVATLLTLFGRAQFESGLGHQLAYIFHGFSRSL